MKVQNNTTASTKSPYIAGRLYDWCFIIGSPLLALAIGYWMSHDFFQQTANFLGTKDSYAILFYMALTQGHLYITVFRTHGNTNVFKHYPLRFTLIPVLLYCAIVSNQWIFTSTIVLAFFWDVYHSGLQTFGLSRIYDRLAGNDPKLGRRADMLLNLIIYIGPILGGALLISHLEQFTLFEEISAPKGSFGEDVCQLILKIPQAASGHTVAIRTAAIAVAMCVFVFYLFELKRICRLGYKIPPQKIALIAITAVVCLMAWGFNSFFMGYFIINLFHAVQYFALVWVIEKKSINQTLGGGPSKLGKMWRVSLFVVVPCIIGMLVYGADVTYIIGLQTVCALMHFWYDGFVWSVRAKPDLGVAKELK